MNPLVIIPARGGSKGAPRKNIKLLHGKPLIQYTIEAAQKLFDDNLICVSTDDIEIKEVVEKHNLKVPFLRPYELAADHSGTYEVLMHAVNFYEVEKKYFPDTIILLQPTSPFRNEKHLLEAIDIFIKSKAEIVVSVKETQSNPYYVLKEEDNRGWLVSSKDGNFSRRQDCPKVYELNGAIYIIDLKTLKQKTIGEFDKVKKYEMSEYNSIDIDTPLDWKIAESLINFKK